MTNQGNFYPESEASAALRADINRLFSPELSRVLDTPSRDIFLRKDIWRRLYPRNVPPAASQVAMEGYQIRHGAPIFSLYRGQNIQEWFGRRRLLGDFVHCDLTDFDYSGGPNSTEAYYYSADLLKPEIPQDERFARIVRICLDHAGPES